MILSNLQGFFGGPGLFNVNSVCRSAQYAVKNAVFFLEVVCVAAKQHNDGDAEVCFHVSFDVLEL